MNAPVPPTDPRALAGLSEIAGAYDVLLCDIWGVIHNGREAFPAACAALRRFAETRGPVVLISNAARPSRHLHSQLAELGAPRAAWSAIVTSGDATRPLLAERAPGPVWSIGLDPHPLYEGLNLTLASPEDAAFVSCIGPDDDETETPEDYRERLAVCARRGLEMICANPDKVVQRGDRLIYCGGALADLYETLGGRVLMAGKPHAPIYALAIAEAGALLGRPLERARVLCVGDGAPTDVRGAMDQHLDCLFVAGGIHGRETTDAEGRIDPARAGAFLAREGASARYGVGALAW